MTKPRPPAPRIRLTLLFAIAVVGACGGGSSGTSEPPLQPPIAPPVTQKVLPRGAFASVGPLRSAVFNLFADPAVTTGVLLSVPWNLCDTDCLLTAIQANLDSAQQQGRKAALIVSDSFSQPDSLKAGCQLLNFDFRGQPKTACLPWDTKYLEAKKVLIRALGTRFDSHEALAYVYVTGAASTNGNEGHWRVKESTVRALGYTPELLAQAYEQIFSEYRGAFARTPLAFEVHGLFLREPGAASGADPSLWNTMWSKFGASGRVGVAAWWCAERLSLNGAETTAVWHIVQDAAVKSFTICQTVASPTREPWQFSDATLGLNYGTSASFTATDSRSAFNHTVDWALGLAVHAAQPAAIRRFSVIEPWYEDVTNNEFLPRLQAF